MHFSKKYLWTRRISQIFFFSFFLFIVNPAHTGTYGGYHYGHGFHHYGHHGHSGFSAHVSSHNGIGTAGYVVLGILGAAILTHIISNAHYERGQYHRSETYRPSVSYNKPAPVIKPPVYRSIAGKPVYSYGSHEGWDWLTKGNTKQALNIFAIQSQQDLDSGIPKIGFAIAAAVGGESDRGIRAMRKAVRIDPASLNKIDINKELVFTIDLLTEEYQSMIHNKEKQVDESFMVAALSYLKQDYASVKMLLAESDHSQSANNLRTLIKQIK